MTIHHRAGMRVASPITAVSLLQGLGFIPMHDDQQPARQLDARLARQGCEQLMLGCRPFLRDIVIAADRDDLFPRLHCEQHVGAPDIAGMNRDITLAHVIPNSGIEETVGISKYGNPHERPNA